MAHRSGAAAAEKLKAEADVARRKHEEEQRQRANGEAPAGGRPAAKASAAMKAGQSTSPRST
jgi:hypothetical protein